MFWGIILIAAIAACFVFPLFRRVIIVVALVLVVTVFGYVEYQKQQTEESKKLVRPDQLQFSDMGLGQEYGSGYKLTGRVKNNSPYSVFEVKAKVQILDCDEKSHCNVIGEDEKNIAPLLPPEQVRDIEESIYFSSTTRIQGHFQWNYAITEVQGRE